MGFAGTKTTRGKRKLFRTVGFCRYTGLNGLATSGWQPARTNTCAHASTQIWRPGHVHTGRKLLLCLTINGACLETRLENSTLSRSPSTHRLSSSNLPANSFPHCTITAFPHVTLCGLNGRFFYFTGPTKHCRWVIQKAHVFGPEKKDPF